MVRGGMGPVAVTGGQGRHHPEVDGRLVEPHPAGDVEEDVLGEQRKPDLLLQHRHQQRDPVVVDPHGGAPRGAEGGSRDQRLQLHQDRPAPLQGGDDRAAGGAFGPLGEEELGGVGDLAAGRLSFISKTPISLVEPKRFFTARRMR